MSICDARRPFFLLLFCLLNLEELYHNQNLHSQIRRDVSRDQTSERKTRGKKRRYFEILVFTPAGTTRRASCVCVFERTGPFIKSAEPVRMILVIHWSGRMPYSLPWVTYWPYIVEMEWYAFFVCLLFINLVLKMAGRRDRLRSWGYPSFGSLSLSVCLAFAHIFFFSLSLTHSFCRSALLKIFLCYSDCVTKGMKRKKYDNGGGHEQTKSTAGPLSNIANKLVTNGRLDRSLNAITKAEPSHKCRYTCKSISPFHVALPFHNSPFRGALWIFASLLIHPFRRCMLTI